MLRFRQKPAAVGIGDFRFDRVTGELSRNGTTQRLRPQAASVLGMLVDRAGDMVSREELQQAIWPDAVVDYDLSLNVCIRQIRAALGDQAGAPRYVETLPRRGYRLMMKAPSGGERKWQVRQAWLVTTGGLLGALVVAVLGFGRQLAQPPAVARMAVLPFRSIPADASLAYLEEGLSEDVITALAGMDPERLTVIARTSSFDLAKQGLDPVAIGARLESRFVLEGAIRDVGAGFRVTMRLLDVDSATYVWSHRVELSSGELASLDHRLVERLTDALAQRLSLKDFPFARPSVRHHPDPQARDAVLRARYLIGRFTRDDAQRAITLLEQAAATDVAYAEPFVALGRARLQLGDLAAADAALERARQIDPETPGIDHVAGRVDLYGRGKPWEAVRHLALAANRHPGVAGVRRDYANALAAVNRLEEATGQGEMALDLDPVSSTVRGDVGWIFYYARQFERAREVCRSTLELRPESVSALECVLLTAALTHSLPEEIALVETLLDDAGLAPTESEALVAAVRDGQPETLWRWLLAQPNDTYLLGAVRQARLHALLGQHDRAAKTLAAEYDTASRPPLFVAVDPLFREAREQPILREALLRAGHGPALDVP